MDNVSNSLKYFMRRLRFRIINRDQFLKFQRYRRQENEDAYSLKPFDDYQCVFIHIPKCAGQSIRKSLFANLLPGHITLYTYQMIFPKHKFEKYFKFSFVRNPMDRLVSAFMFMKSGGAHEQDKRWSEEYLSDYPDFESFVMNGLKDDEILEYPHFRPQTSFLKGQNGKIQIDFIGHLETIQRDFNQVTSRLGIKRELVHINKTKSKRNDYDTYYTDKMNDIVGDVYKTDFSILGYDRP